MRLLAIAIVLLYGIQARAAECVGIQGSAGQEEFVDCTPPPPDVARACKLPSTPGEKVLGQPLCLDLEGRHASVWIGVETLADGSQQLLQYTAPSAGAQGRCERVPTDGFEKDDALGDGVKAFLTGGLPMVNVTVFGESACLSYSGGYWLACALLTPSCEIVEPYRGASNVRGQCAEDDDTPPAPPQPVPKELVQATKLHAQGLSEYRAHRWKQAEEDLARAGRTLPEAESDLGFLYYRERRYPESELAFLRAVQSTSNSITLLNLADLYWDAGKPATARKIYAMYLHRLKGELHRGEKLKAPARVFERAKPQGATVTSTYQACGAAPSCDGGACAK